MRNTALLFALALIACNDDDERPLLGDGGPADAAADASLADASLADAADSSTVDAAVPLDASFDASIDATVDAAPQDGAVVPDSATVQDAAVDAGCQPTLLLRGGDDVAAQGWTVVSQVPSALTSSAGFTRLETSTNSGANSGGQLLLSLANAVTSGQPFKLELKLIVDSVSPHNLLDSAAAILGSFTPSAGTQAQRSQMIYLDGASVGWADDTQSVASAVVDGQIHTYLLEVDAQGMAELSVDGVAKLTRAGFTTNGTIAVGDQTNDRNVDAVMRIQSISKLCTSE